MYEGVWATSADSLPGTITDIMWGGPDHDVIYTSGGAFGAMTEWLWAGGGLAGRDFASLLTEDARSSSADLAIWTFAGESYLAVTGGAVDGVDIFAIGGSGQPALTSIGADFPDLGDALWIEDEGGGGFLVSIANGDRALSVWTVDGAGEVVAVSSEIRGEGGTFSGTSSMTSFEQGGQTYVATLDVTGNAVTLFEVSNGELDRTDRLDASDGLAISMPTAIDIVSFGGTDYAIVAATGSNSLSVLSLNGGEMTLRDQVIDDLNTRFESVGLLETVEMDGRVFIAVSGADSGLSVFTLLPSGRLMSVATLEDRLDARLDDITAMEFVERDGGLQLVVAGEGWDGLSVITVQTDIRGMLNEQTDGDDLVQGPSAGGRLQGGAGDDILIDGAGADVLVGGTGADTFVFYDDNGVTDTIEDFEVGVDQINLSFLGRAYDLSALQFETIDGGIEITFQGESLLVFSQSGDDISQSDLTYQMLFDVTHVATEPLPILPEQIFGENGANFLVGGAGDDVVFAGLQNNDFDEAASVVARLYQAVLGRAADEMGHFSWTQRLLDQELSGIDIADRFVGSREFSNIYGGLNDADFVRMLYQNVLGREPDEEGFAAWVGNLENGMDRADVVWRFSESREFVNAMSLDVLDYSFSAYEVSWGDNVFRIYQAVLGREPDAEGFAAWTGNLLDGMDYLDAISRFVGSREFTLVFGDTTNADFVELLYENVLGRAPDAEGLTAWINNLDTGMGRADVVSRFVDSAEFIMKTTPDLIDFMKDFGVDDILEGGEGDDLLQGGANSDVFVFDMDGHGDDVIVDFEMWDSIELINADFQSSEDVLDALEQRGEDVVLDHDGGSIMLLNTEIADIQNDTFLI
ncbi:DUF4214 domain-containing protein [Pseudooctadecabacter sp.]|uniref:DUF4214 domain-containing protein n=1 Tax=Pseudooctadecabacter sp. TaxID=1966338 RepID=UPI003F6BFE02